ncbi:MAG: hypothetical protein ACREFO_18750 [Acetobacteraceae bacterium]
MTLAPDIFLAGDLPAQVGERAGLDLGERATPGGDQALPAPHTGRDSDRIDHLPLAREAGGPDG